MILSLPVTPTSSTLTLEIIENPFSPPGGGGSHPYRLDISGMSYDSLITVPTLVTSTVCDEDGYHYGYNGKLKDNDVAGVGNHYDYGARQYNPRIGRPLSVDPLFNKFPMLSAYQFFTNNPIMNIDLDGEEGTPGLMLQNAANGQAGEIMFKTKISVVDEYDVYEQVTYRPGGVGKVGNTRADFFLKSKSTGNLYSLEVKTGNAVSTPNQNAADVAIEKGENMEMRTGKTDINTGTGINKKESFKLGGSAKVRVDLKTGTMKVESVKTNPNVKGSDELLMLQKQLKSVKTPIKIEVPPPPPELIPPEAPIKMEEPVVLPDAPIDPVVPIEPIIPIPKYKNKVQQI